MSERKKQRKYRIIGAYDTETTKLDDCSFAYLYTFAMTQGYGCVGEADLNRLEYVHLRSEQECMEFLKQVIEHGDKGGYIPIICAYNLAFDLQTIMADIAMTWPVKILAKSRSEIYAFDLLDGEGARKLRFWDLHAMNEHGVAALGEICGVKKLYGDLDYRLVRHSKTPLTPKELGYCDHDVLILLAWCRWFFDTQSWVKHEWLGSRLLTNAGIIRLYSETQLGNERFHTRRSTKRGVTTRRAYDKHCLKEMPADYGVYTLRKACMKGGLAFTAARWAQQVQENVYALDVTSEYHAFVTGMRVPEGFRTVPAQVMYHAAETVVKTTMGDVLRNYEQPFPCCFHAIVRFHNLRLRNRSVFSENLIAIIGREQFSNTAHALQPDTTQALEAVEWVKGAQFAFGKLYSAADVQIAVNEVELWNISRVYSWDSLTIERGELSWRTSQPMDYVALQTNVFYDAKNILKQARNAYRDGEQYDWQRILPDNMAKQAQEGALRQEEMDAYYQLEKSAFNSIPGNQCTELFRASWEMTPQGDMHIDPDTVLNGENYSDRKDKKRQLYVLPTWGQRITARGRMHLIIALQLLAHIDGARILSGDTDSIKIAMPYDAVHQRSRETILKALEPLHEAVRAAIDLESRRLRDTYPALASDLENVGEFGFENDGEPYQAAWEAWSKCRALLDEQGHIHVTAAGIPRHGGIGYEEALNRLYRAGNEFGDIMRCAMSWDVTLSGSICRNIGRRTPRATDTVDRKVTDYLGVTEYVAAHQAVDFTNVTTTIGTSMASLNRETISWLAEHTGSLYEFRPRYMDVEDGRIVIRDMQGGLMMEER